jgi:hypothetical protein
VKYQQLLRAANRAALIEAMLIGLLTLDERRHKNLGDCIAQAQELLKAGLDGTEAEVLGQALVLGSTRHQFYAEQAVFRNQAMLERDRALVNCLARYTGCVDADWAALRKRRRDSGYRHSLEERVFDLYKLGTGPALLWVIETAEDEAGWMAVSNTDAGWIAALKEAISDARRWAPRLLEIEHRHQALMQAGQEQLTAALDLLGVTALTIEAVQALLPVDQRTGSAGTLVERAYRSGRLSPAQAWLLRHWQ